MSANICLATNYLHLTGPAHEMWVNLDESLDEFGCRLVLMSTTAPASPLPFPVIHVPFLLRDYATQFPAATGAGGHVSRGDLEILENDSLRARHAYPPGAALQGLLACRKTTATVLDTLQPGYVLTWDATSPLAVILHQLARESGLPVQSIERGLLPETLLIDGRGMQAWSDLRTNWLAQVLPASAANPVAYERIRSYYISRKPQKYGQPDFAGGGPALRASLGLAAKKVVVFFGHYDACGLGAKNSNERRYHSPGFASTMEALMALAGSLPRDPALAIVFKPHPLDAESYRTAETLGIKVVRDMNVHALIDLADVVAVLFTSLQFEAVLYDKPVLQLGHSAWWGRAASYEADSPADVPDVLAAALHRHDWPARQAAARTFVTWLMQHCLVGATETAPADRNLRDFARFLARTALDSRHLPPPETRWQNTETALANLKGPR